MSGLFLQIVNMSISASYLILAVLALRLILRKVPKNLLIWLWALVAIRLALPISLESALSLIPKSKPIPMGIALAPAPAIDSGVPVIDRTVNPMIAESLTPNALASVNPIQVLLAVSSIVWLIGIAAMLLYAVVSYLRLSKQVGVSLRLRGNLYLCDGIATPFILGVIKPKIYLPSDRKPEHQSYVLKHERAHLRHHDNLWKPLGFLLLSVYWFHPLVWIAYLLFCRDLEMACDERALENPCLAQIWSKTQLTLHLPDSGEEYTVATTNYMIDNQIIPEFYDSRVIGGFAYYGHSLGFADLVCTAKQGDRDVICILLDAERKFHENGWSVVYYGNFEEMDALLNTVLG